MTNTKTPYRTCVACGARRDKRSLIRIVRTPESGRVVGASGRESGRGAYLCPARACWLKGLKGAQLERALRTRITDPERRALLEYADTLKESQEA
jgi:predicted RNA-binding protein YlxR (DUF448 family)